jgi:N-acetylmuramoyl-L-alanine amidase
MPNQSRDAILPALFVALACVMPACHSIKPVTPISPNARDLGAPLPIKRPAPLNAHELARTGDEIVIAGRYFHTGAPVVLWTDAGGYDAYRTEKRFVPFDQSEWKPGPDGKPASPESPNRYSMRFQHTAAASLTPEQLEQVRGGGWTLDLLQQRVDQFVLHFDVCGTSRQCFRVLHDMRGLSVHFMLDIDGTIYQTLDVKERAWQATTSNDRSVGIEIANIGAYPPDKATTLDKWYERESPDGPVFIKLPASMNDGGVRTPGRFSPARPERVVGQIQGKDYAMYDLTPQQYHSLARLTATLCEVLPNINCDYPRDASGNLITMKLDDDRLRSYSGILGHYHIQENKVDPGPAFNWNAFLSDTRAVMRDRARP